jgi:hypothetical protein
LLLFACPVHSGHTAKDPRVNLTALRTPTTRATQKNNPDAKKKENGGKRAPFLKNGAKPLQKVFEVSSFM